MLPCALTQAEILDASDKHVAALQAIKELEAQKNSAKKQYDSQIAIEDGKSQRYCNMLLTKCEHREITCVVEYHTPDDGRKTIRRTDTNDIVAVEMMTAADLQRCLPLDGEGLRLVKSDAETETDANDNE